MKIFEDNNSEIHKIISLCKYDFPSNHIHRSYPRYWNINYILKEYGYIDVNFWSIEDYYRILWQFAPQEIIDKLIYENNSKIYNNFNEYIYDMLDIGSKNMKELKLFAEEHNLITRSKIRKNELICYTLIKYPWRYENFLNTGLSN